MDEGIELTHQVDLCVQSSLLGEEVVDCVFFCLQSKDHIIETAECTATFLNSFSFFPLSPARAILTFLLIPFLPFSCSISATLKLGVIFFLLFVSYFS